MMKVNYLKINIVLLVVVFFLFVPLVYLSVPLMKFSNERAEFYYYVALKNMWQGACGESVSENIEKALMMNPDSQKYYELKEKMDNKCKNDEI